MGHRFSAADLIERAAELGAELIFPAGFDSFQSSGLIPCLLNQQQAAFEFTSEATPVGSNLRILHFEARSSYASFAACAYIAATMALITGGAVRDDDGAEFANGQIARWLQEIELPTQTHDDDHADLRIPVTVVGLRSSAFLQLRLDNVPAGAHLARRLVESVAVSLVPPHLRTPNSRFIIVVRDACDIVAVEPLSR